MLDTPAEIMKKFNAPDSEARVYYGENKAGINNRWAFTAALQAKKLGDEIGANSRGRGMVISRPPRAKLSSQELELIQARL